MRLAIELKILLMAGFTFDFIFASFSHFSVDDPIAKVITPLVMLLILIFSFVLKEQLSKVNKEKN